MDIVYAEKYYKQIQEKFPKKKKKQIDKIVKYGLRSFFAHNKFGGDVLLKSNYYTGYVGKLFKTMSFFAIYYNIKMRLKLRIKYKRAKTIFNGKYYFGLNKEQYELLFGKHKRKSKSVKFEKLRIFKLYDECLLYKPDYIFEFPYKDVGFLKIMKNFIPKRYNLIAKKDKDGNMQPVGKEIKYKWKNQ